MYLCQRPGSARADGRGGQVLVPTLSCFYGVAGMERRPAGADVAATSRPRVRRRPTWSPLLVELAHYNLEQADARCARPAPPASGSPPDTTGIRSGTCAIEIRRMIAHGLTAAEALTAATAGAAYALGLDQHVGTVAPGQLADLVIFDGDPLAEPELLSRRDAVWLVIQHGAPVAGRRWSVTWASPRSSVRAPA